MPDYADFPDTPDGLYRLMRGAISLAALARDDMQRWNETPIGETHSEHGTEMHGQTLHRLAETLLAAKPRFNRHGLALAGIRAAAFVVTGRSFPTAHHAAFVIAAETIAAALPDAVRREVGRLGGTQAEAECTAWHFGLNPETATLGTFELIGRAILTALCDGLQFEIDGADFDAIDAELVIETARVRVTVPTQREVDGSAADPRLDTKAQTILTHYADCWPDAVTQDDVVNGAFDGVGEKAVKSRIRELHTAGLLAKTGNGGRGGSQLTDSGRKAAERLKRPLSAP